MQAYEICLGKRVRFTQHIERKREGYRRWWEPCVLHGEKPREGIVVGLRCLYDGVMTSDGDPEAPEYEVEYFTSTDNFPAALVAFDLRRKPILVKLTDLHPVE
jgi:hypothetical protein